MQECAALGLTKVLQRPDQIDQDILTRVFIEILQGLILPGQEEAVEVIRQDQQPDLVLQEVVPEQEALAAAVPDLQALEAVEEEVVEAEEVKLLIRA